MECAGAGSWVEGSREGVPESSSASGGKLESTWLRVGPWNRDDVTGYRWLLECIQPVLWTLAVAVTAAVSILVLPLRPEAKFAGLHAGQSRAQPRLEYPPTSAGVRRCVRRLSLNWSLSPASGPTTGLS